MVYWISASFVFSLISLSASILFVFPLESAFTVENSIPPASFEVFQASPYRIMFNAAGNNMISFH